MEGGGEGRVGRKWVGIGWFEGEFTKGAGRRPGGAERRRNGRSPFARRPGGRPAAGSCGFCGAGEEMRGRGGAGKGERPVGAQGWGRSPFRRSRKPQAEPAETARRAVGLRRDAGAFAGWGRSVPQMGGGGRKDCTCGRFFGIIGDGSTERRWRMCRL